MNLQAIFTRLGSLGGDMASLEKVDNGWVVRFSDIRQVKRDKADEEIEAQAAQAAGMTTPFGAAIRVPRPDEHRTFPRAIFCGTWEDVLRALHQADDAAVRTNEAYASGGSVYPERR